ncbi:hypothetical protein COT42_00325 [Candidatus Saganbacteria bacterium CG08_land_8_20_14_0_20_45_16]|uniref:Uncharacterized protein n=1 Tax=Candidatus Saganbacteria bacterium CG08_land_8_20_14_0_20_45_16 TaxID=2014293 RepID=A0A2H0Y3X4_UNCSA|nr:MAG: hypothetical protein COT42_00325 [Candidatus Saganbacteria bacterium CG08_land_8_20_14_0_20_45_16]
MTKTTNAANTAREHTRYFPQNKYGYTRAIASGEIRVKNNRLSIETPPLSLDNLPFFSCHSATALMARVLREQGFQCVSEKLFVSVLPHNKDGPIPHEICRGRDNNSLFLIGMTPFDKLLKTFPFKRIFIPFCFEFEGLYPESTLFSQTNLEDEGNAVNEKPNWPIPGFDSSPIPLFALAEGNRIKACSLGIASKRGIFNIYLLATIMEGQGNTSALTGLWTGCLLVQTASNQLAKLIETVSQPTVAATSSLETLFRTEQAIFAPFRENDNFHHDGLALFADAWPAVVTFIKKLPVEEIQAALSE